MSANGGGPGHSVDVAIVGAGAAGIAAGRHLRALRPELSMQILEAGRRCGGRAFTMPVGPDHIPLDLGCGWLHGGRDNVWMVIAARTGFTIDHSPAAWDGAGRDLGLGQADQASVQQAMDTFFERAETVATDVADVPMSAVLEPGCRWNGLIGAIGTYINGAELDLASLRDYQRYDPGRGPDPRVREGYGRLVESYAVDLPVALATTVSRIDHSGTTIRLTTSGGTLTARSVVVTVPTGVLADEAIVFDPPLPAKVSAAADLPLGVADKLFLSIPDGVDLPAEHHVMGATDSPRTAGYHVRPFGRPVIECYLGGQLARDLEREGQEAALAFARNELGRHFEPGLARRLEPLCATAWAAHPHINGAYSYARPGASDSRATLATPVENRLFFAGEACSRHRFSTAHGAYETGVAAAEAVAAALAEPRPSQSPRESRRSVQ